MIILSDEWMKALTGFVVRAKRSTYANPDAKPMFDKTDHSHGFGFTQGRFSYRDRYYGANPDAGMEIVWYEGKPVWAMNYYGAMSAQDDDKAALLAFLKESLAQVPEEYPFRGPELVCRDGLRYNNEYSGDIRRFSGREIITISSRGTLSHDYRGGLLIS